jgi:hypothetical protein
MSSFPSYRAEYTQYITRSDCPGPGKSPLVTIQALLSLRCGYRRLGFPRPQNSQCGSALRGLPACLRMAGPRRLPHRQYDWVAPGSPRPVCLEGVAGTENERRLPHHPQAKIEDRPSSDVQTRSALLGTRRSLSPWPRRSGQRAHRRSSLRLRPEFRYERCCSRRGPPQSRSRLLRRSEHEQRCHDPSTGFGSCPGEDIPAGAEMAAPARLGEAAPVLRCRYRASRRRSVCIDSAPPR